MAYEAYRVLQKFGWRGWVFAPSGECQCGCRPQVGDGDPHHGGQPARGGGVPCCGEVGSGCVCRHTICRCSCGILPEQYGGDIWLVEDNHPRKGTMLGYRFVIGDASIPPIDELLSDEKYKRLLSPRRVEKKVPVGARR